MTTSALCREGHLRNTLGFRALALRRRDLRPFCAGPAFVWNMDEWTHLCRESHPERDTPFCGGGSPG
jgi:hypothetical protein